MLAVVHRDNLEKQEVIFDYDQNDPNSKITIRSLAPRLCCQECGADITPALGCVNDWHFKHSPGTNTVCDLRNGETPSHRALKRALDKAVRLLFPRAHRRFEVWLPEIRRRADVLVTMPNGVRWALEAQRSGLKFDDLIARTKDYQSLGIKVLWAFDWWQFEYGKKLVPKISRELLKLNSMVIAAKELENYEFEFFTVEARTSTVNGLGLVQIDPGASSRLFAQVFLSDKLGEFYDGRIFSKEEITQSAYSEGFEQHLADIRNLMDTDLNIRPLDEGRCVFYPWVALDENFDRHRIAQSRGPIEHGHRLALCFWIEYRRRVSVSRWQVDLERLERNLDVRSRAKSLSSIPQLYLKEINKPVQTAMPKINNNHREQIENGLLFRHRVSENPSAVWTVCRIENNAVIFTRADGSESKPKLLEHPMSENPHLVFHLNDLKKWIQCGEHQTGMLEVSDLARKLLRQRGFTY